MILNYNEVPKISRDQALHAIATCFPEDICKALVSIALHEKDWRWAQDRCLELLESKNVEVGAVAATCLGHIARIHKKIDKDRVIPALENFGINSSMFGIVEDAMDDISMFT